MASVNDVDGSVMNCLNPLESLREKAKQDIRNELARVVNTNNNDIKMEVNAALQLALRNKEVPPSAAEAKSTYLRQLNELLNRFERTTNYNDGQKALKMMCNNFCFDSRRCSKLGH